MASTLDGMTWNNFVPPTGMTWQDFVNFAKRDPVNFQYQQVQNVNSDPSTWDSGGQYLDSYNWSDPADSSYQYGARMGENGLADIRRGKKEDNWAMLAAPFLAAAFAPMLAGGGFGGLGAGAAGAAEAGLTALPAGGMTATGTAAPWLSGAPALGSGLTDLGATAGATTGGGMGLGSGFSGIGPISAATSGGGAMDGLIGKGLDFATSKGGSALIGGLLGGLGSRGPDSMTATSGTQLDPRMDPLIYGQFLPQVMANLGRPQNAGIGNFGLQTDNFLGSDGFKTLQGSLGAATSLQNSNITAPQIQAPSQNNIDLAPAYNRMINGNPAENPYLTGAIQGGINQSNYAFGNYLGDATKAVQDQLASIRGGAIVNGAMGGSRQGIAEGRALGDFGQNITRAATQFGQHNTDAAVGAQAGSFESGQNRTLSALTNLGGQQYGVATGNAQLQADTNRVNSGNQIAGINATSGLLGQLYGIGTNNDAYAGQKLAQTSGLLSPYTGLGSTQTQTTPLYNNPAAGILGGALGGAGLWSMYNPQQRA